MHKHNLSVAHWLLILLLAVALCACNAATPTAAPQPTAAPSTATPLPAPATATTTPTATVTPEPSPTPQPLDLGLAADLPASYAALLPELLNDAPVIVDGATLPLRVGQGIATATLRLAPLADIAPEARLVSRFCAVVAPFEALQDDLALDTLRARWSNPEGHLLTTAETVADLEPVLGAYAGETVMEWDLLPALRADPEVLGLLPFDRLDPTYKVLTVDGVDVLDNHLTVESYPLAVALTLDGALPVPAIALLRERLAPLTNRDPERLTRLIMTGVTAMCRLTAERMETYGRALSGSRHIRHVTRRRYHPRQQ